MKLCFFSPYIPKHMGGGEKHFFDVALAAAKEHDVFVALPEDSEDAVADYRSKYEAFMGQSLDSLTFIVSPLYGGSFLTRSLWTAQFDGLYYVTDGSLFFSLAKKNYLHIQIPLLLDKSSVVERLKLWNWGSKNTNSAFTKKVVEKSWNTQINMVLNPTVSIPKRLPKKKEKIILNVGRFFTQLHAKRQDVLISAFKELRERHPSRTKDWKLVLIGQVEDEQYFAELQAQAKNLPVVFVPNASHQELREYYKKASVYWHATGYDIDEATHPEKVEHFGITTAEAMAHGVVPVVLGKGGQPEVLGSLAKELSWSTKEQCIALTARLLKDTASLEEIRELVKQEAERFSHQVFTKKVKELFS